MSKIEVFIFKSSLTRQLSIVSLTLIASLLFVSFGLLVRYVVDHPDFVKSMTGVTIFCTIFIGIRLAMPLSYSVIESLTHDHYMTLESALRSFYFDQINRIYIERLEGAWKNEFVAIYESAMSSVGSYVRTVWAETLPVIFQTLFILGSVSVYLSWDVAVVFSITIVVYIFFVIIMTNARFPLMKRVAQSQKKMNGMVHSLLAAGFTEKAYASAGRFNKKYQNIVNLYLRAQQSVRLVFFKFGVLTTVISVIGSMLVLACATFDFTKDNMTLGSLIMLATFLFQVFLPLNRIGMLWRTLNKLRIDFALLEEALEKYERYTVLASPPPFDFARLAISLDGVYKKKYDKCIFENLQAVIEFAPGLPTLITGNNGSGKSTLARLISGIDKPDQGALYYNNTARSLDSYGLLPEWVALSSQSIVFINGTIGENLELFLKDVDLEGYHQFAHRLSFEKPLHYEVGDQGRNLSAGERQKLCILLALLKRPQLLILDEPTVNLDSFSGEQLKRLIEEYSTLIKVLIITHDKGFLDQFEDAPIYDVTEGRVVKVHTTQKEFQ